MSSLNCFLLGIWEEENLMVKETELTGEQNNR